MRRFLVTNPNLSVGKPGDIVDADQLNMTDEKLDEWAEAGFGMELFEDPLDRIASALDVDPGVLDSVAGSNHWAHAAPFDPSDKTVAVVLAYLADHPDEIEAVVEAETRGRNRSGIVNGT